VAQLAESFNRAAAHIEELVGAHRLLLANASHELRTPLSRIRLGVELLKENPQANVALERDIADSALIDEILWRAGACNRWTRRGHRLLALARNARATELHAGRRGRACAGDHACSAVWPPRKNAAVMACRRCR
jgi:signal transduction histidine kinase